MLEALGLPTPEGEPLLHYADTLKTDIWPLERVRVGGRERAFESVNATESFGCRRAGRGATARAADFLRGRSK